jgi:hypothetical protein
LQILEDTGKILVLPVLCTSIVVPVSRPAASYYPYISAQQSAQFEPVSGTSGVGYKRLPSTTFQQDQSAKKKRKKSNNENEEDASTILQESDESGTIKILK